MKLPGFIIDRLVHMAGNVILARPDPDFVIGEDYLRRWFITPWSRYERGSQPANWFEALKRKLPNIYLHNFRHSDDDRALHDHPWWNVSILISGSYFEHTIAAGGVNSRIRYESGDIKFRTPSSAHRVEIVVPCWTIFITGPSVREWGFHCPQGWRHWREFVSARDAGKIGRGCA